ncbi:type VII secretion-associated serine protease mycosin [Mycobacterium sherrisii]|uniref:Type VII secretion-associated serine protease mycosin n=1 Tax=Mycobacterium sherrisii TaxID=243061 RepID=A0A1E3T4S1_9MYCO|nr:type VII secretion-associated serine protease mycosin [Mycobacterium sherrisii]MEC4762472.1 type VII secretion-associated serine protease mycosin [Mycobacterium sherrisii]ODR09362.1 type VII secretion-associated serine protease mycosin [Mycobacterium sherrisii]
MGLTASVVVRLVSALALAVWSPLGMPSAQAVSPPEIDDRMLPKPARPAPPRPTVQRKVCAMLTGPPSPGPKQFANLDLPRVWQLTRGAGQRVAVIDTGVSKHPRLPDVVPGGDYVFTGDGTQDCDAHGTLVAGIIAATTGSEAGDAAGIAPDVTLISIRQSSAKFAPAGDASHAGIGDVNTMASAVRTAADLGASVINISSVACVPATSALDDRALGAALAYAVDIKNAVIVAAAGNTGSTGQCPPQRPDANWQTSSVAVSPAWYDDYVLTVGSVRADGTPSAFSLAGPWVDVAAIGEAVTSLTSTPLSGTSYAAPVVSGLAALIRARFPALTARQVMQRIEATAHHPPAGWNPLVGNGAVDVLAAVSSDSGSPGNIAKPPPVRAPAAAPPQTGSRPADLRSRDTALRGTALCVVAALCVVIFGAARRRLGSPQAREHVAAD